MEQNIERVISKARETILNFNQLPFPVCEKHMIKKIAYSITKKDFSCNVCDPDTLPASFLVNEKLKSITASLDQPE